MPVYNDHPWNPTFVAVVDRSSLFRGRFTSLRPKLGLQNGGRYWQVVAIRRWSLAQVTYLIRRFVPCTGLKRVVCIIFCVGIGKKFGCSLNIPSREYIPKPVFGILQRTIHCTPLFKGQQTKECTSMFKSLKSLLAKIA
jgi:hypothetical protein